VPALVHFEWNRGLRQRETSFPFCKDRSYKNTRLIKGDVDANAELGKSKDRTKGKHAQRLPGDVREAWDGSTAPVCSR
jgi:hypothetical protein